MKVLVVGLGSIGMRHVSNIRLIDPGAEISVWHLNPGHQRAIPDQDHFRHVSYSFEEAIRDRPDVALIATPSSFHTEVATGLAREGIDLFIEKPISSNLAGLDNLLGIARKGGNIIMVGYNFRFHRPMQILSEKIREGAIGKILGIRAEVGQYLPDWRPGKDYRFSASARRELGGGAMLELSHELDYARWFLGEVRSVTAQAGRVSDLEIDVEDTADIILKFSNNATGSIHLDMVQRPATRYCHVMGSEGALRWDGITDSLMQYSVEKDSWITLHPTGKKDRNEMYVAEIRHFLDCVRDRREPPVTGIDGKRVLEIALAALRSSEEQRTVVL